MFKTSGSSNSVTSECQSETREVHGRKIMMVDSPGFFDNKMCEDDLKSEITKCVTLCAPGVHAFLIVLKVERFTEQEKEVISKIKKLFSEEALKYSVIIFTHGDQLEDQKIEDFVKENHDLRSLVEECGGRCHVMDNRYWDKERNNEEVKKLLNTIDKMVEQNNGEMYTNEMLEQVHSLFLKVQNIIRACIKNISENEIVKLALSFVSNALKIGSGITTGILLGALLGIPMMILRVLHKLKTLADYLNDLDPKNLKDMRDGSEAFGSPANEGLAEVSQEPTEDATAAEPIEQLFAAIGIRFTVVGSIGAIEGGFTGYKEAVKANSVGQAVKNTAKAVWESSTAPFEEPFQNKGQTKTFDTKND
uniref:AIG1-type G domain-containing protein n=2 Tax=Oryzias melastigma TaxID=30732 RepID=A0A3B3CEI8_ORYME